MGESEFSNIGKRGGNDKNTTCISGNSDRYALLCNLILIKMDKVELRKDMLPKLFCGSIFCDEMPEYSCKAAYMRFIRLKNR